MSSLFISLTVKPINLERLSLYILCKFVLPPKICLMVNSQGMSTRLIMNSINLINFKTGYFADTNCNIITLTHCRNHLFSVCGHTIILPKNVKRGDKTSLNNIVKLIYVKLVHIIDS